jgi:spoIIIJ-associated protein
MKTIEVTGRTVDEAIENGLRELRVSKDKVEVEVIEQV